MQLNFNFRYKVNELVSILICPIHYQSYKYAKNDLCNTEDILTLK